MSKQLMQNKTVIVTGANTGCGLELAKELAGRGARVLCACRDEEKAKEAIEEIKTASKSKKVFYRHLDLASFQSIRDFVEQIKKKEKKIDVLVNNAGVMCHPRAKSEDGHEMHTAVNFLGPFMLTHLLLDLLKASGAGRIVNVCCIAYRIGELDLDDLGFETREFKEGAAFSQSKLAMMLYSLKMARYLEGTPVTVNTAHPGVVSSEAHRYMPYKRSRVVCWTFAPVMWLLMKQPRDGAQTALHCAISETEEGVSGKFYKDCYMQEADEIAKDEAMAAKVWDVAVKLTGVTVAPKDDVAQAEQTESQ